MFSVKVLVSLLSALCLCKAGISPGYLDLLMSNVSASHVDYKDLISTCLPPETLGDCIAIEDKELGAENRNMPLLEEAFFSLEKESKATDSLLAQVVRIITDANSSDARKDRKVTLSNGRIMSLWDFANNKEITLRGLEEAAGRGRSESDKKADSILSNYLHFLWSFPTQNEVARLEVARKKQRNDLTLKLNTAKAVQEAVARDFRLESELVEEGLKSTTTPVKDITLDWGKDIVKYLHLQAVLLSIGYEAAAAEDVDVEPLISGLKTGLDGGSFESCNSNVLCVWGFITAVDRDKFKKHSKQLLPFVNGLSSYHSNNKAEDELMAKAGRALNFIADRFTKA